MTEVSLLQNECSRDLLDRFKIVVENLVLALSRNTHLNRDRIIDLVKHYDDQYGAEEIRSDFEQDVRTPNIHTANLITNIGSWPV